MFTSSRKREIRQFDVVVVQQRQINVQKSVMHVEKFVLLILTYSFWSILDAAAVVIA